MLAADPEVELAAAAEDEEAPAAALVAPLDAGAADLDAVLADAAGAFTTGTGLTLTTGVLTTGVRTVGVFTLFAWAASDPAETAITQASIAKIRSIGLRVRMSAHLTHGRTTVHPQPHPILKPGGSKAPSRVNCGQSVIVASSHQ